MISTYNSRRFRIIDQKLALAKQDSGPVLKFIYIQSVPWLSELKSFTFSPLYERCTIRSSGPPPSTWTSASCGACSSSGSQSKYSCLWRGCTLSATRRSGSGRCASWPGSLTSSLPWPCSSSTSQSSSSASTTPILLSRCRPLLSWTVVALKMSKSTNPGLFHGFSHASLFSMFFCF